MLSQRDLPCLMVIPRGPGEVPALREVHGELTSDLSRTLAIPLFESLTRPQVESRPVPEGDARVEHVLVQRMNEGIAAGHRPVGPLGHPARAQKIASPRQGRTSLFAFLGADAVRR